MAKRTVAWRSLRLKGDATTHMRGAKIDVPGDQLEELDAAGAFEPLPAKKGEKPKAPKSFEGMSEAEIEELMREKQFTTPQVLKMVNGSAELARLAIKAEDTITGGSGRDQLIEALAVVIANDDQQGN